MGTVRSVLALTGIVALFMLSLPGGAIAQSEAGAAVIGRSCGRCHNVRAPEEFSLAEWVAVIPHMRERAHLTGAEATAILAFLQQVLTPQLTSGPSPASASASGGDLVVRFGCRGCHEIGGEGGKLGPSLDGVVTRQGADFVRRKLADPQFNNPLSPMPKVPLTDQDIETIIKALPK